jgi:hypothetical protein
MSRRIRRDERYTVGSECFQSSFRELRNYFRLVNFYRRLLLVYNRKPEYDGSISTLGYCSSSSETCLVNDSTELAGYTFASTKQVSCPNPSRHRTMHEYVSQTSNSAILAGRGDAGPPRDSNRATLPPHRIPDPRQRWGAGSLRLNQTRFDTIHSNA